jgi:xanthine dehydrogenase accessory factor
MSTCDVFPHISYLTSMGRPVVLVTETRGADVIRSVISEGVLVTGSRDHVRFYDAALRAGRLDVVEGDRRISAEAIGPFPGVLIVGSGPIATSISRMAREMGMPAVRLSDESPGPGLTGASGTQGDAMVAPIDDLDRMLSEGEFVVVANEGGSPHDVPAVEVALRKGAAYVGLMASERRARESVEELIRRGIPEDVIRRRLYTPAGLDLGAKGAGEIALSILAEMLAVWRGGTGAHIREMRGPFAGAPRGKARR